LDNVLLDGPPTFLKIDVEGAEEAVLDGAKQTIRKHHPRIAVSVYHKGDDLRRIPEQVLSFREDYDVYLRHYSEGVVETVAFFVPRPLGTKE
jgi:hypothetical protein